jgi:hypothetical protein
VKSWERRKRSIHHTTRMGAVLQLAPNKNHTSNAKVTSVQINSNPCKPYAKTDILSEGEGERYIKNRQGSNVNPSKNKSHRKETSFSFRMHSQ